MIREIVTDPEQLHIPSEEVNTDLEVLLLLNAVYGFMF
jgi:predicted RNA-binding protein YlqC (UPF0109 family)